MKRNKFQFLIRSGLDDFSVQKSGVINFIKEFFRMYKTVAQRKKSG